MQNGDDLGKWLYFIFKIQFVHIHFNMFVDYINYNHDNVPWIPFYELQGHLILLSQ